MLDWQIFERLRIGRPEDVRPAAEVLRDVVFELSGLHVAPGHDISSRELMRDGDGEILASSVFSTGNADRWWLDTHLALTSPLAAASRVTAEPFWCNARGIHGRSPNPLLAEIDLHDFVRRAHAHAAIVVPVHMPFGQVGAVGLLPPADGGDDLSEPFERCADVLALYIRRFLTSYVEIMQPHQPARINTALRKREVECLRWAALGKTNEEVAAILGLSRATVRFHIHNASERLNAVNRDQTIFKAAQLGYLALRL